MNIKQIARRIVIEEFGLKAAEDSAFGDLVVEFQTRLGLDDEAMGQALANNPVVRRDLAALLSVGESFFLRCAEHEQCVVAHVHRLLREGARPVIWSAGCARGEEPYSVAMVLTERLGAGLRDRVMIVGTDVDGRSLDTAREGVYGSWSFRGVGYEMLHRYFHPCDGGHRVNQELLGWPRFQHLSIQEHFATLGPGTVDVVLFRNVAIYLTEPALRTIHEGISRVLAPGGLLLQAVTDPAPPRKRWSRQSGGPHGVYVHQPDGRHGRQPLDGAQPSSEFAAPVSQVRPLRRRALESKLSRFAEKASVPTRAGKPDSSSAAATSDSSPSAPQEILSVMQEARNLANAGRVTDAVARVSGLLRSHPHVREAYVLRGQLHLHDGNSDESVKDLRSALFIAPADVITRYWYSVALERAGWADRAAAQRMVIEDEIAGRVDEHLLEDGETTVSDMRGLILPRKGVLP